MRKLRIKKPKILSLKIEICKKLRANYPPINLSSNGYSFTYYSCYYKINKYHIYVYFQRYIRNVFEVDYIDIRHRDTHTALKKSELISLNKIL